jgi:NAD(P)H-hydrate epimerase
VIFKGAPSLVASPDGEADLCSLGNDGMATAGSGDVLAGILVGLLAQGLPADETARLGTMVHSRAGDIAAGEFGRRGMIAGDMIRALPYVWRELEGEGTVTSEGGETPEAREHAEEDADSDDSDQPT